MPNNFKNSFVSVTSAGEYYQSTATDSATGPQTVYTANNGSGCNSVLIELDASNTGTSAITFTAFIQDTSATLGTITSVVSSSDTATVTTGTAHGLKTGMYVNVTGSTTNYVNGIYKVTVTGTSTFTYAQNSAASNGTAAGTIVIYKAYHIVKDAPIPVSSTLKVISGQKVVLNNDDKVLCYASAGSVDAIASILEDVT
jgi:hypothetical protein|tara:strand:- start:1396 stop:1992 length:597 start_codon:yes stop_codon:yes gene_type:complete